MHKSPWLTIWTRGIFPLKQGLELGMMRPGYIKFCPPLPCIRERSVLPWLTKHTSGPHRDSGLAEPLTRALSFFFFFLFWLEQELLVSVALRGPHRLTYYQTEPFRTTTLLWPGTSVFGWNDLVLLSSPTLLIGNSQGCWVWTTHDIEPQPNSSTSCGENHLYTHERCLPKIKPWQKGRKQRRVFCPFWKILGENLPAVFYLRLIFDVFSMLWLWCCKLCYSWFFLVVIVEI